MANILRKSDGVSLVTVPDGRIGSYDTPLQLVGRNVPDYGTALFQNLLRMTENFASPVPPEDNPVISGGRLEGQFWYDSSIGSVKYYNGNEWTAVADMATITDDEFVVASALRFANPLTLILSNDVSGTVTFTGDDFVALDPQAPDELTNAVQMNVAVTGVDVDNIRGDINAKTAETLLTPRRIDIDGVVKGNVMFDGSEDIRISTSGNVSTNVTLTGDVIGSATITNFGNVSLSTTVNSYDHDHDSEYYLKSEVDTLIEEVEGQIVDTDISNLVTLNTKQSISGEKEFTGDVDLRSGVSVHDFSSPGISFTRGNNNTVLGRIGAVAGAPFKVTAGSTDYLTITTNGNMTIGDGRMTAGGFTVSSDRDLKDNINDHTVSSDFLDLKLKSWNWNQNIASDGKYITGRESGIIAQEIEQIEGLEGCVYTHENGYKSVDYGKLALHLVLALKDSLLKK